MTLPASGGDRVLEALCRAVRERASVAVEWRDDRRRRLFFFASGELVLVQSNLKSETPERVAARAPGGRPDQLRVVVMATRLSEAVHEPGGEVIVHPGAVAPEVEPGDIVALLWDVADRLPPLADPLQPASTPSSGPLLARLPVGAELQRYLRELDGTRSVEDVVAFGPDEPETIARAIALAHALGALRAEATARAPSLVAETRAAAPPSGPSAAPSPAGGSWGSTAPDDIAGLIRGELEAPSPPRPTPPATPPIPAPLADPRRPLDPAPGDEAPFGGASATITFGARRAAPPPPPRPADPMETRFADLSRVRGAQDHFQALGTTWQDPPEVHRRAYIALAQRLHPDRYAGDPPEVRAVAEELFERIRAAWEVLGDDGRREAYIAKVVRGEKTEDEKAMDKVRAILEAESDFKRGIIELNAGRIPAAHELFSRAAAAVPEELEFAAYAGYTGARMAQGRDDMAVLDGLRKAQAALAANEKLDGVWVLLGLLHRLQGDDPQARRAFVTALKHRPTNPDATREMRRMEREKEAAPPPAPAGGSFFSRLFGKK